MLYEVSQWSGVNCYGSEQTGKLLLSAVVGYIAGMDEPFRQLLARTPLNVPFDAFLQKIQATYPQIGEILKIEPIFQGYEDANIKLQTTNDAYVLKIFARRNRQFILDYVKVLSEASVLQIPVVHLLNGAQGTLSIDVEEGIEVPYYVSIFFEGSDLEGRTPTIADIQQVARYLASLNTLQLPIKEDYDAWGNRNFLAEHEQHKSQLGKEYLAVIEPTVKEIEQLDYSGFKQGVIHGDMQRKHVLKNEQGEYCILDLGCMAYAPIVFDISILFAWFCFAPDTWPQRQIITETVLSEYAKRHTLSDREVGALPTLTRAAYAAYYQKTALLITNGDHSEETRAWHENAKTMLALSKDWKI